jgi:hypothetical protein
MRMRSRLSAVVPAVLAAVVMMGGPALAAGNSMTVAHYGHVMARGAAVSLQFTVTCSPVTDPWGNTIDSVETQVYLSEAVRGGQITQASAQVNPVTCNDLPQVLKVYFLPSTLAFHRGKAVAWGRSFDMSGAIVSFSIDPTVVILR